MVARWLEVRMSPVLGRKHSLLHPTPILPHDDDGDDVYDDDYSDDDDCPGHGGDVKRKLW